MPQTTYTNAPGRGYPGLIQSSDIVLPRINNEVSAEVAFGSPVKNDSTLDLAALRCTVAADDPMGIVAASDGYAAEDLGLIGVKPKAALSVMVTGSLLVAAGGAVTRGQRAYYNTATGRYVAVAVPGTTIDMTGQAFFDTAGSNGSIVNLFVDFRNKA